MHTLHQNGQAKNVKSPSVASSRKLVLFDFDGTITTKDTLLEFLIFYRGYTRFLAGMIWLSPILVMYKLKLIPNWKAKQYCLRHFIGGENADKFRAKCSEFTQRILPGLIRPGAAAAIRKYAGENATVAVVSASAENWVSPWCEQNGLLCVATQLEIENGTITGNLCGENCYGPVKASRIRQQFNLSAYNEIIAYGDSSGDREMFALAHRQFYRPFRTT